MARIDVLLSRVNDEFPNVPKQVALRALSDATKEFCKRTHAWQDTTDNIQVRTGVDRYDVGVGSGVQIVALKDVRFNGNKVYPLATEVARLRSRDPQPGVPVAYIQVSPSAIQLVRVPDEPAVLQVTSALTLTLGNVTANVADSVIDEYGEAIACGAKARLVRQSNQPWYAPDAVAGYAGPFYSAVAEAKRRTMTALGEAEVRIQIPVI